MRTVLVGRGRPDPAAHQFIEEGKGFLGDGPGDRPLPDWLTEADLAYVTKIYMQSGYRGGLNWYRNIDRNWELTAAWQGAKISQPSLFLAGSRDGVVTGLIGARQIAELDRILTDLKAKIILDGAGHWVQQERPDEVNAALIDFLKG
jgi:pimeloyl-ACP methyl ester carboxylesterase